MRKNRAKAVVFDLEGTLIDLFDSHVKAFREVVGREFGLEFTAEDLRIRFGMKPLDILRDFLESRGVTDADCESLVEEKQEILRKKYARELKVLPGVKKILGSLRSSGVKVALASSSPRRNVDFMLGDPGLAEYFSVILAAEDVEKAKPDPALFLLAAEKLGLKPGDCVAVDDAIYGVRAAKAAGMRVVAVLTGSSTRKELEAEKPDEIVESLEGLNAEALTATGV